MRLLTSMFLGFALIAGVHATPQAPAPVNDILARSLAAHGGDRLSSWQTMTITGTIDMEDGITYRAAYRIWAKAPDKLKVEQDMTVERGSRLTYEYFRNGSIAWSRRNLRPANTTLARLERWMNQCYGVAHYAKHATSVEVKPDASSDWMVKAAAGYEVAESRPAYVLTVTLPSGTADLYIDKKTYRLLEEVTPEGRRLYAGFKDFGGTVHPTQILEVTKGRNALVYTPITYAAVRYGEPIEDWIFEEDMPKK